MKTRIAPLIVVAIGAAALLAGCTPTITLTASAEDIADLAEGALEEEVGSRPDIDCGTGDVDVVVGAVVDCILTDPETGEQYEAPVTIETVEGTTYTIGVQVGALIGGPEPEPTVDPGSPTVPGADIAALAAGALEPVLGFRPGIVCEIDEVEIFAGNAVVCGYVDDDGAEHDVQIEITEFDGSTYSINAEVIS